jgi:predicted phosphodiesterase
MKYGILSDIHANAEALETVLAQLRAENVAGYICLGDIVGYGPDPNECVAAVRALPNLVCIAGNHDLAAVGKYDLQLFNPHAREALSWTVGQLTPEHIKFLVALPLTESRYPLVIVHGALPDPMDYILSAGEARATFNEFSSPACLIGHTHIAEYYRQSTTAQPFGDWPLPDRSKSEETTDKTAKTHLQQDNNGGIPVEQVSLISGGDIPLKAGFRYIINPGSIGQPRDANPKAAFGIWDEEANTFAIRRIAYNIRRTQRRMMDAGLPPYLVQRLAVGR